MRVVDALDDLALQPFFYVCALRMQVRNTVDDVNREIEAIHLIENGQLQRRVDVAFFLISTHVNVLVVRAPIAKLVDQRRVRVEVEDDRLVGGEKRIEVAVRESMRVLRLRHKAEQIDDVYEANLQLGEPLLQNRD